MDPILIFERDARIAISVAKSLKSLELKLHILACANEITRFISRYNVAAIVVGPSESKLAVCRQLKTATQYDMPVLKYGPRETLERRVSTARMRSGCVRLFEQSTSILYLPGGVTLDLAARTLGYLSDTRVNVARAECAILILLANGNGNTIYKCDMLHQLWGRNDRRFARSLDVHMHGLRQKLAMSSLPIDIQSIRGRGFVLRLRCIEMSDISLSSDTEDAAVQTRKTELSEKLV